MCIHPSGRQGQEGSAGKAPGARLLSWLNRSGGSPGSGMPGCQTPQGTLPGDSPRCGGLGESPSPAATVPCDPGHVASPFGGLVSLYFLKKGLDQVVQGSSWC